MWGGIKEEFNSGSSQRLRASEGVAAQPVPPVGWRGVSRGLGRRTAPRHEEPSEALSL